jgi:hypothetical protein
MGKARSRFFRGHFELLALCVMRRELMRWRLFCGVFRLNFEPTKCCYFAFMQTDISAERDAVQRIVVDWWRASRHAAVFLGGARDCGF